MVKMILILGSIIAVGPLTIDMYLPAFPSIGEDLAADPTSVQLTLTGTLLGLAVGQLLVGPLADAFGRRRPLLYGLGLHVVAALLCLVAPSVAVLGVLRVLQGLGAAAATVVASAVVRDLVSGVAAAKLFSRLILVLGAAPILAPSLGSQLLRWADWRGIFVALAIFGAAIGIMAAWALPETLPPERRQHPDLRTTLRSYRTILRDRTFVGLTLVLSLGMATIFSYVGGSSYVMQEQYGLSEQEFAVVFGLCAVGLIGSAQLNVRLLNRYTPRQLILCSLGLACAGMLLALAATAAHVGGLLGLLIPMWLGLCGVGLANPNAGAMALSRHGEAAGTAASIQGSLQFGLGALTAPVVGALGATGLAMVGVMAVTIIAGLTSMLFIVRAADMDAVDGAAEPAVAPA
ncbi:MAG: multidrug effflux MFS transporter [Micromonosporaceae bacterium]|nr:multidrug effflux MFS transporter [Micromonosporaceae bacterium]